MVGEMLYLYPFAPLQPIFNAGMSFAGDLCINTRTAALTIHAYKKDEWIRAITLGMAKFGLPDGEASPTLPY